MAVAAALMAPTSPMIGPPLAGSFDARLRRRTTRFGGPASCLPMLPKAKPCTFLARPFRRPGSVAALRSRQPLNELHGTYWRDEWSTSCNHLAAAASVLSKDHMVNHPSAVPALSRHRAARTIATRASSGIPYNFHYHFRTEENKPKWWWRTLSCIPYLFPLHMMSLYAEGAHQFLPFLDNFEILSDPFTGNQLPGWFSMVYCLSVYYLVVRRKSLPHVFRAHVIMALLLDNAVQIIGIVARWMPYWSKLDAPFWTVVACGLLLAIFRCIRNALNGNIPEIPFFSEAALMHTHMP